MIYVNIQGMRAVAALLVLATHVLYPLVPMRTHPIVPWLDGFGPAGVDIFFVISGFIIYQVAQRSGASVSRVGRYRATKDFFLKRLIRIYPIYWIVFGAATIAMPFAELAPEWLEHKAWWALFLLLDQPNDRLLAAWTLTVEVYFYAVATIALFVFPRHILWVLLGWFAVITTIHITQSSWMYSSYATPLVLEFLFGIVVAWLVQRGFVKFAWSTLIVGVLAFFTGAYLLHQVGGWSSASAWYRVVLFGIPSAVLVYSAVALERTGAWTFPVFMQKLGDASYSLYLWHQMIFALLASLLIHFSIIDTLPRELYAMTFLIVSLIVGLASYYFVELPILKGLGKLLVEKPVRIGSMPLAEKSPSQSTSAPHGERA